MKGKAATITLTILTGAGLCVWLLWKPMVADKTPRVEKESITFATSSNPKSEFPETKSKKADVPSSLMDPFVERLLTIQKKENHREIPGFVYDLVREVSLPELQDLLEVARTHPELSAGLRDEIFVAAYERWYELDPVTALREMDASALSPNRKASRMEVLLEDWASREPGEMLAFLEEEKLAGVSSDSIFGALARGSAAKGELAILEEALAKINEPKLRSFALKSSARVLQRDEETLFESWLPKLTPQDQAIALAESAWILADEDIELSLQRMRQLEELGAESLPVTRSRVVVKWTRNEPAAAGQWVLEQQLPEAERVDLFAIFFRVWLAENRKQAVAWAEDSIARGLLDESFLNQVASN